MPHFPYRLLEARIACYLANPILLKRRVHIDELVVTPAKGIAEVPHRTKNKFCICATVFMHVTAAMKRLAVVHHLLNNIVTCQGIHVDILFPFRTALVLVINSRISSFEEVRQIVQLDIRQHLW